MPGRYRCALGMALLLSVGIKPLWAGTPKPPFKQCVAVGADSSCAVLVYFAPDGSPSVLSDPSQGPYDKIEDTLIGIQNSSNRPIYSISISSSASIFGFDGDGICGTDPNTGLPFNPAPPNCPYGPTTYEGPGVTFTITSSTSGRVNFPSGIQPGKSTYFSLEEANFTINLCGQNVSPVVEQISNFGTCGPVGVKTPTWGEFGAKQTLVADSGETLQVQCAQHPTYADFELIYTPAGSSQGFTVGLCPFEGGCNSGWFSHAGKNASTGNPSCFIETNWTSRDYGANDIPNEWTMAGGVDTSKDEPVLDWAVTDFNVVTNNVTKTDQEFVYNVGPPVPTDGQPGSLCTVNPVPIPEGALKKTVNLADPNLQDAQVFFAQAVQNLQSQPPGGASMSENPVSLADLNRDGKLDSKDFSLFLKAFATCVGNANYNPAADYDGDGCVTLKDYQTWTQFYNAGTKSKH